MANLQGDAKQIYVAELFARIAGRYDLMNSLMTGGMHHSWKRRTARIAAQGLTGPALDIATGTGDLAFALSRQPGISHAVGVDLLPEMIALGQKKNRAKGTSEVVTLLRADAVNLPFPQDSFACATAGFSLRNMPDLRQAISEMVRVVRPGGRVTTLELTPMGRGVKSSLFRLYFHRLVPIVGQLVTGDRNAYSYLPQSVDYFLESERLASLFRELGLVDVSFRKLGFGTVAIHQGTKPSA